MRTENFCTHQWGYAEPKLVKNNQLLWRRICLIPGCNFIEEKWSENNIFPTEEPVLTDTFSVTGHVKIYGQDARRLKNPWGIENKKLDKIYERKQLDNTGQNANLPD